METSAPFEADVLSPTGLEPFARYFVAGNAYNV